MKPQAASPDELLNAALEYASRGWRVYPCKPGTKEPCTPKGFNDATTDESTIRRWWGTRPTANIGIKTGGDARLVVLDVDARNGGVDSLLALEAEHGEIETRTVSTGSGDRSRHFYFHASGDIPTCRTNLRPGLDLKAEGGGVIAPPSVHPSGAPYVLDSELPVAPIPAWLEALLNEAEAPAHLPLTPIALEDLRVSDRIRQLIKEGDVRGAYPSRSEPVFAAIRAMVTAGHTDDEMLVAARECTSDGGGVYRPMLQVPGRAGSESRVRVP